MSAAGSLGGDVHLLVLGSGVDAVAQAAAKVAGVSQVKVVDDPSLAHQLAEAVAAQVVVQAAGYSHVVAAATAHGRDFMPRVAALLDVAQISDVTGIDAPDTFRRPIYAGNAIATVQSADPVKVLTVRGTSFDEAPADGGSAAVVEGGRRAGRWPAGHLRGPRECRQRAAGTDGCHGDRGRGAAGWAVPRSSTRCWSRSPTN